MAAVYDRGDRLRIITTFRNIEGELADPTAVLFRVIRPDGTIATPQHVKDSQGVYHADITLDQSGVWRWRTEGTGAVEAADEGFFRVKNSAFP